MIKETVRKRAITAYRAPLALPGTRVRTHIAVQFLRDEGTYGTLVAYAGANLTVRRENIVKRLDTHGLLLCELDAVLVSHDGRVGYVVRVGQHELRVHQQMVEVIA